MTTSNRPNASPAPRVVLVRRRGGELSLEELPDGLTVVVVHEAGPIPAPSDPAPTARPTLEQHLGRALEDAREPLQTAAALAGVVAGPEHPLRLRVRELSALLAEARAELEALPDEPPPGQKGQP